MRVTFEASFGTHASQPSRLRQDCFGMQFQSLVHGQSVSVLQNKNFNLVCTLKVAYLSLLAAEGRVDPRDRDREGRSGTGRVDTRESVGKKCWRD